MYYAFLYLLTHKSVKLVYSHKLWNNLVRKSMGREQEIRKYFPPIILLLAKIKQK